MPLKDNSGLDDVIVLPEDDSGVEDDSVSLAYNFEAAVAANLAEQAQHDGMMRRLASDLQTALHIIEPGAALDMETPADGHCLFHALQRGGVASLSEVPCKLSVFELRNIALSMAT